MKMVLLVAWGLMMCTCSWSQNFELKSFELGARAGLSNYQGDLVKESINIGETNLALGGFARVFIHDNIGLDLNLNLIKITGNDRNYTILEDRGRHDRGLKMENRLLELSARVNYFPFMDRSPVYGAWMSFQPYIGTGLSVVLNDPELTDQNPIDGTTVAEKDSPAISVPIVFGLKYVIKPQISASVETVFNVAFTDNLDGYTYLDNNDWFMFHSIILSWHFIKTTSYNSTREKKKTYFKKRRKLR